MGTGRTLHATLAGLFPAEESQCVNDKIYSAWRVESQTHIIWFWIPVLNRVLLSPTSNGTDLLLSGIAVFSRSRRNAQRQGFVWRVRNWHWSLVKMVSSQEQYVMASYISRTGRVLENMNCKFLIHRGRWKQKEEGMVRSFRKTLQEGYSGQGLKI